MPPAPEFRFAEFRDMKNVAAYADKYPRLKDMTPLFGSDAHSAEAVQDAEFSLELPDGGSAADAVFDFLAGGGP